MKKNFTDEQFATIANFLANTCNVIAKYNKGGNIDVFNPHTITLEKWTLYKTSYGYLWRRHNKMYGYCYPLNMRNRKTINYNGYSTKTFNMLDCYFANINDALNYFEKYYKNRLLQTGFNAMLKNYHMKISNY